VTLRKSRERLWPESAADDEKKRASVIPLPTRDRHRRNPVSPSSFDDMGRLLEMEEILAYTTDQSGIKRFARALRGALLSRAV
jgi:hypothetical protein